MIVRTSVGLVLLLLFTGGGCTSVFKSSAIKTSSQTVQTLGTEFPDSTNARWTCRGQAKLKALPEEIFPTLLNPLLIDTENPPKGVEISIDHSASQAGPERWGIGSVVQIKQKERKDQAKVLQCKPHQHVEHGHISQTKRRTIRPTTVSELRPSPDGGTTVTLYWYASPDHKPWWLMSQQRAHELVLKRDLDRLVNQFGGKIVYIDNGGREHGSEWSK